MSKTLALPLLLLLGSIVIIGEASEVREIVVETPVQSYEQPTVLDHDACHERRRNCLQDCADNASCQLECPICPELIEEAPVLQGVNDTAYVAPPQPALNTTNIIRLTNEISNTINQQINLKNVLVQQNSSLVGGRFGLGFDESGPCCHVVMRNCTEGSEENTDCKERSRHRVCGKRCLARTMLAKIVVQCDPDEPENCYENVEYVPAHKRKSRKTRQSAAEAGCGYLGTGLPYVPCSGQIATSFPTGCPGKCHRLTLGYISQHGLPPQCSACFPGYAAPIMAIPMPMWYGVPYAQPYLPGASFPSKAEEPELPEQSDQEWNLESEKCVNSSGKLEDCPEGSADNNEATEVPEPLPPAHLENGDNKDDSEYDVPIQRRRRHQSDPHKFIRSKYSLRGTV